MIGSLVSIGLLVLAGYLWYTFREVNQGVPRLNLAVNAGPSGGTTFHVDGKDQNILVVGNDDRQSMTDAEVRELHAARDGGSLATDTMMIVHIPADGSKATLISLPRDTLVQIPDGYRPNKLNSAYASAYVDAPGDVEAKRTAGADLLIKTITNLTGLTINHYVQVDLLGFYRISTAIGGVPVTLCHAVDDTIAANQAAGLPGGSGLKLSKGTHDLSGVQALQFVRQRHFLPHEDLDRVKRQQYFLTSAFRQVASVGIVFKLRSLGDALKRSVYFDSSLNLLDLAQQLKNLTANNIVGKTIPTYTDANGNLTADPQKVQAFVDKVINGPPTAANPTTSTTPGGDATKTSTPSSGSSTSAKPKPIDSKCIN